MVDGHGGDDVSAGPDPRRVMLRAAAPEDVDAVRALVARTVLHTYGPFSPSVRAAAAEQGTAALVGAGLDFAGAWLAVPPGNGPPLGVVWTGGDLLRELFIDPPAQGRGLGRLLLHVAEREIAARGHALARLDVAEPNAAARRFYAARGWRENGRTLHGRWDFALIAMVKALPPAGRPDPA